MSIGNQRPSFQKSNSFKNENENIKNDSNENNNNENKENNNNENKNKNEEEKPWNKVAKDPSLIQKGSELFVGNLCFETLESDLYENFKDCGEIIDVIIN